MSIIIIIRVMEMNFAFLCNDVARLFRKRFAEAAREVGGTGAQWRVLLTLRKCPGINQGMLAERLDVEPISACRMVDRLEQAGLVERRRDPADRRVWQLFLTDAATPVVEDLHIIGEKLLKQALSALTPEESQQVFTHLSTIRDTLIAADEQQLAKAANDGRG